MIEVKNLHKYFGELQVLRGIDETIKDGEVVCVIGPSGSGKSTFLRCLNLLEEPTEGKVIIDGECINEKGTDIDKVREKLGMVFQNFNLSTSCLASARSVMMAPRVETRMTGALSPSYSWEDSSSRTSII